MKKLLKSLLLGMAILIASPNENVSAKEIVIENDNGGFVSHYHYLGALYKEQRHSLRLRGYCGSACTIFLYKKFGLKVCAERNAELLFHMPFFYQMEIGGEQTISRSKELAIKARSDWNRYFLNVFPRKLDLILKRATLENKIPSPANGDDNDLFFGVRANEVLPRCR